MNSTHYCSYSEAEGCQVVLSGCLYSVALREGDETQRALDNFRENMMRVLGLGSVLKDADDEGPAKDDLGDGDAEEELDPTRALGMRDGLARWRAGIGQDDISQTAQQEEGIGCKAVQEHRPVHQPAHLHQADEQRDERTHELVARIREKVHHRMVALDVEQVRAELDGGEFDQDDGERARCAQPQHLGMEARFKTEDHTRHDDVRDEGHGGDVQVGRVDVVARRQVAVCPGRGRLDRRRRLCICRRYMAAARRMAVCARPGLVAPGKQHDAQLVQHVRVGHVEVVLEHRHGQQRIEVLLHVLATHRRHVLAKLHAHLCGCIVHDRWSSCTAESRESTPALRLTCVGAGRVGEVARIAAHRRVRGRGIGLVGW
ncbi:hypothetical protein L1887_52921 [Cichorium endivia]|nr:hypothetical protein L1887_52921 [Cichorium endivia]